MSGTARLAGRGTMHDLITRLAVVDGDAASALRVISHFDALPCSSSPRGRPSSFPS
ncbi:hypothetical protein [Actinocorallia aurea]